MGLFSLEKLFGVTIRESANDGSDFTNPDADYRRLFLGEDGQLHVKDSSGTVTDIGTSSGLSDPMTTRGDIIVRNASNVTARLAKGAAGAVFYSDGTDVAYGHPTGAVVQVVIGTSSANDTSTSETIADSSLTATITPKYSNSVLLVRADGECQSYRVSGSPDRRDLSIALRNTTNSVDLTSQLRGPRIVAASSVEAQMTNPIALAGTYTVDSTSARTFKLRFATTVATDLTAAIRGDVGGCVMTIMEIRA